MASVNFLVENEGIRAPTSIKNLITDTVTVFDCRHHVLFSAENGNWDFCVLYFTKVNYGGIGVAWTILLFIQVWRSIIIHLEYFSLNVLTVVNNALETGA